MATHSRESIPAVGWKVTKATLVSVFLCILLNISFAVLTTVTGNIGIINLVFDILLTLVIIYAPMCDHGNADANLCSFGYLKPDYKRGFIIGLFSLIPFYVITFPLLIMKIVGSVSFFGYLKLYRVICSPFMIVYLNLCPDTSIGAVSYIDILIMFLMPFIFVIACGIFYIFGLKRITISDKLVYKK